MVPPEQAVFLLAVESQVTLRMTSCNINVDLAAARRSSHHLPRLPDGAAQEHAEDHPKHLKEKDTHSCLSLSLMRLPLCVRPPEQTHTLTSATYERLTIITPMVMPTPPMMCSLESNTSSIASGQLCNAKGHRVFQLFLNVC